MIVLYWMTPDPVTVVARDSLLKVWRLLREHKIRRLPVVEEGDHLIGLIGRADLYRYVTREEVRGPEEGVRAALEEIRVRDAMSREPETCEAHAPLESVADRMRRLKLGAFPVLHRGHLVGIISETDILGALGELAGLESGADRITLKVDGSGEPLYQVVDLCRRYSLELIAVLTHAVLEDRATMTTLRVRGARVDDFVEALWKAGFDVVDRS